MASQNTYLRQRKSIFSKRNPSPLKLNPMYELTSNNTKIVCPDNSRNAYGNIYVDSTKDAIHKWIFKIGKMKNNYTSIGIVESSVNKSYGLFTNTGKGYAYRGDGYVAIPKPGMADHDYIRGKPKYKKGDIIKMIYTPKNQTLSYFKNDNDAPCVVIYDIKSGDNIKYKIATYLYEPQDSLELISCQLNMGDSSNEMEEQPEEKEISLEIDAEMNTKELQQKIPELDENEQQQLEIERLKQINKQLMMQRKKSHMKIKELENEVKLLKSEYLDVNNYKAWKWQEILQWIMALENRKFKAYEQDLKTNLSAEQPSGSDLAYVNEDDIRRWGVKKFSDIKMLYNQIQELRNYDEIDTSEEGTIIFNV